MKRKVIGEIIGWYGTCAIIIAYALVSFKYLSPSGFVYQILNGTGALGVLYISLKRKAYQPALLNVVWALIALIAIVQLLF